MFRTISLRSFYVLVVLVSLCFTTSYAQQRFSAGPRIGLNLSNYWGNADNLRMKPGVNAGVFLSYSSLNHFGISADVLYSQRGAKYDTQVLKFTQRVNYLEIPVVARYYLTLNGDFRPNIFVGPSLGIKLNAKRLNSEPNVAGVNAENNENFRDLDLGATAGFQLNWRTGNRQHFLIDARYTLGLSEVQSNLPNVWGNRNNLQNSTISVSLGYAFGVGPEFRSRYSR